MRDEYDFSKAQKNPYAKNLKKQIIINIDCDTIDYFKDLAESLDMSYETLISLYLRDCATSQRQPPFFTKNTNSVIVLGAEKLTLEE